MMMMMMMMIIIIIIIIIIIHISINLLFLRHFYCIFKIQGKFLMVRERISSTKFHSARFKFGKI
jgi:hypothetical protein